VRPIAHVSIGRRCACALTHSPCPIVSVINITLSATYSTITVATLKEMWNLVRRQCSAAHGEGPAGRAPGAEAGSGLQCARYEGQRLMWLRLCMCPAPPDAFFISAFSLFQSDKAAFESLVTAQGWTLAEEGKTVVIKATAANSDAAPAQRTALPLMEAPTHLVAAA